MPSPSLFTSVINSYLPEPQASLLNGILFGVSLKTTKDFYQQLKTVGLLHLVVLSGINITILATIVGSITGVFSKRISIMITILTIILFIFFVGPQAPILRAGFMGILTLVAILYGRKTTALYTLFLSGLLTAIFWSDWIKTISFQLSYAATLGLILLGKTEEKKTKDWFERVKQILWREIKPSLAAQIFTAPIIFFYFKEVSIIAPLANLCVSFVVPPLMIFGFLTAFLGKIHFLLGLIPAYICYGLLSYMVFVVENLSKLPFIYFKF